MNGHFAMRLRRLTVRRPPRRDEDIDPTGALSAMTDDELRALIAADDATARGEALAEEEIAAVRKYETGGGL